VSPAAAIGVRLTHRLTDVVTREARLARGAIRVRGASHALAAEADRAVLSRTVCVGRALETPSGRGAPERATSGRARAARDAGSRGVSVTGRGAGRAREDAKDRPEPGSTHQDTGNQPHSIYGVHRQERGGSGRIL
jgi:hypothetical protein